MTIANNLGYPRIGKQRELKWAIEGYWTGELNATQLESTGAAIRRANWETQRAAGIDLIPSNDFSLYDQVLDTIALVGAVPARFRWKTDTVDLDTYFAMARGSQRQGPDATPLELTKWFDTNYHYLVPELARGQTFRLGSSKPFDEFEEALALGIRTKPVLLGPVSFLLLGKSGSGGFDPLDLLDALLPVYREVITGLAARGAEWIQLDEPCFVQDRARGELAALTHAYADLAQHRGFANLIVQTYFDDVGEAYPTLIDLPVQGIGLDFVRGPRNREWLDQQGFPEDKVLAAGLVDGRNVWIADLDAALALARQILTRVTSDRLFINPSASLLHVPLDARLEEGHLDTRLLEGLAFAEQKLDEVVTLVQAIDEGTESVDATIQANAEALERQRNADWLRQSDVAQRVAELGPKSESRTMGYPRRRELQQRSLGLPLFPTTTIGSFPQTPDVRRNRIRLRRGAMSIEEYDTFIAAEIQRTITLQEEVGLDVLTHGEFERADMVEYFADRLDGFATTRQAWVQSYGTRSVRPPIIYGDVSRLAPMTTRWSDYAQSLTTRPVKGMLTGPVTLLNWSFVRDDQPRSVTGAQIALALRDEIGDLERAGLRVIQVDEPALREGLPLHANAWLTYLGWAVACFRLATAGARPETQIHSHMCYGQFDDIIAAIAALDVDVISLSNSRSDLELLGTFARSAYPSGIGPGVYDVHSPRVPSVREMELNLRAASKLLDPRQLWVNPDCGLKTRRWDEVTPALRNLVQAARNLREQNRPA